MLDNDTIITLSQLFLLGLATGFSGPCLVTCLPLMALYLGSNSEEKRLFSFELLILLFGRLTAYVFLGYIAGLSTAYLNGFTSADTTTILKYAAGALIVAVGLLMFKRARYSSICLIEKRYRNLSAVNMLILGVIMGLSPCPPLISLLLEIVLMSKVAIQGACYAFAFGAGTFISGFLILLMISGVVRWLPNMLVTNRAVFSYVNMASSMLIIVYGAWIIAGV